ncbi:MAG: hypothetical protein NTU44_05210 [Bacteroidetes bacterium]|nr:hypothetical protein [Bacteroidota bacterium]
MYSVLKAHGLGNFTSLVYWSSSENSSSLSLKQKFDYGLQIAYYKDLTYNVEAIRAF